MERGWSGVRRDVAASWRLAARGRWLLRTAVVLAAAAGLCGCSSITDKFAGAASQMPGIGLPEDAPARPAESAAFPAVHDMPAPRQSVVLSEFEQQKLEDDLVAARDRQQAVAGVPVSKEPRRRQPPGPGVVPAVSGKAIY
jgi:hypothetical protein